MWLPSGINTTMIKLHWRSSRRLCQTVSRQTMGIGKSIKVFTTFRQTDDAANAKRVVGILRLSWTFGKTIYSGALFPSATKSM